jgi:hypothetical protein
VRLKDPLLGVPASASSWAILLINYGTYAAGREQGQGQMRRRQRRRKRKRGSDEEASLF